MARKRVVLARMVELPLEQVGDNRRIRPPGEQAVTAMARVLSAKGQVSPLLVGEDEDGNMMLVAGAVRLAAARRQGWERASCVVMDHKLSSVWPTVERIAQGLPVDPWEACDRLALLKSHLGCTQVQLGAMLGRGRNYVADVLALEQVRPDVRRLLTDKGEGLNLRQLRFVAREAPSVQPKLAERLLQSKTTSKELERERKQQGMAPRPLIQVRRTRREAGGPPVRSAKEWRRYLRRLLTDLKRVDAQEKSGVTKAKDMVLEGRRLQKMVHKEARRKRQELNREIQVAKKQLLRKGETHEPSAH